MEDSLRVVPSSSSANLTTITTSSPQPPTSAAIISEETARAASNNVITSDCFENRNNSSLESNSKQSQHPVSSVSSTRNIANSPGTGNGGSFTRKFDCSSGTSTPNPSYVSSGPGYVKSHSSSQPVFGGNQRRSSIIAHVPPFNQSVSTASQAATNKSGNSSATSPLLNNSNSFGGINPNLKNPSQSTAPISLKRTAFNSGSAQIEPRGVDTDSISSLANERFGDSTIGNYLPPDAISVFHTLVSSAIDQCLKNSSDSKVRVSIFSNLYDSITKNNPSGATTGASGRSQSSDEPSERSEKEDILLKEAQKESELNICATGKSAEMMETTKSTSITTGDRILGKFPTKKNGFSSSNTFHTAIGVEEEKKSSKIISERPASSPEDDSLVIPRLRIDEDGDELRKKRPSALSCSDGITSKCRKNSETNEEANSPSRPSQSGNSNSRNTCNEYKKFSNNSKLATVQASTNYAYKESNTSVTTATPVSTSSTVGLEKSAPATTLRFATSPTAEETEKEERTTEEQEKSGRTPPPANATPIPLHKHHHHQLKQQSQRSLSSDSSVPVSSPSNYKASSSTTHNKETNDEKSCTSDNNDIADDLNDDDDDNSEVPKTSVPSETSAFAQNLLDQKDQQAENAVTSLRKLSENFFNNANISFNDSQKCQRSQSNNPTAGSPSEPSTNAVEQLLASSSSSDMVNRLTKYLLEQHLFNGYPANATNSSGPGSMEEVGANVDSSKDVLSKLGFNSQTSELATAVASAAIAVMSSRVDQPRSFGSEANTGLFSGPYSTPSPKPIGVTPIQIMKDEPLNLSGALQAQRSRKENSTPPDSGDTPSKESRPGSCDLGLESSTASPEIVVMDPSETSSGAVSSDIKCKRMKSVGGGSMNENNSRKGSFNSEDVVKDILNRNSASASNGKDESNSSASTPTSAQDVVASANIKSVTTDSNPLLQNAANSALSGEDKNSFRRLCHNLIQSEILKLSNCEHAIEKKVVQQSGVVGKVSLNNNNSINHQLSAALQKQVTSPESVANSHPTITIAKLLHSATFTKDGASSSLGSSGGEEVKTIQAILADTQMEKRGGDAVVLTSSALSSNSDFTLIDEPSLPTYEQLTELSHDLHATLVAINPRTVLQRQQIRALTLNCKRSHTAFTGLKMVVECLKERLADSVALAAAASSGAVGGIGPGTGLHPLGPLGSLTHLNQPSNVISNNPAAAAASVLSSGAVSSSKRKMSPIVTSAHAPIESSLSSASSLNSSAVAIAASSPPSKIVKISSAESLPALSSSRSFNNHSLMNSPSNKLFSRPSVMNYPDEPPRLLAAYSGNPPDAASAAHLAAAVASTPSAAMVDSPHLHHYRTPLASSTITSNSSISPHMASGAHHPGTHAAAAAAAAAVASENAVALHARLAAAADYRANSLLKHPSQHTPPHPGAGLPSQTAAAVAAAAHNAYGNKLHGGGYIEGCPCALCVQNIEKQRAKVAHALIKSQQHGLGHMSALSSAGAAIHHNSTANTQPPPPGHPSAGPPPGAGAGPPPGVGVGVGVPPTHPAAAHNHATDAVAAAAQYQSAAAAAEQHLRLYPTYPSAAHVPKLLQAPGAAPAAPPQGPGGHRSPILSSTPGVGVGVGGLSKAAHSTSSNPHFGTASAHYPHVSPAAAGAPPGAHELESQLHHSAAAAALGRFAPHLNSVTPSSNSDPAAAILALHHESQLKAAAAAINAAALQQQHHQLPPPPPPNPHYGRHQHPSAAAVAAAAAAAAQSGGISGPTSGGTHNLPPSSGAPGSAAPGGPPGSAGGAGAHVAPSPLAAHSTTNHHSSPYSLALAAAANTSVSPMESTNAGGLNYSSATLGRQTNPLAPPSQYPRGPMDPSHVPVSTPKSDFTGGPVSSTANSNSASAAVKPAGSQCANCGGEAIYLCSGCRKIWYCSQECQVKAWERHYVDCFGAQVR